MRRMQKVLLLALALLLFTACGNNSQDNHKYLPGTDIALTPDDCNIHQVVTRIYTDEELEELKKCYSEFESIEELNERYPIECVREVLPDDEEIDYVIRYCGEKRYASVYVRYDPEQQWHTFDDPNRQWYIGMPYLHDARHDLAWYEDRVKIGLPLRTMEAEVDPYGEYPHHSAGVLRIVSVHCTSDGYLVRLYYTSKPPSEASVEEEEIEVELY